MPAGKSARLNAKACRGRSIATRLPPIRISPATGPRAPPNSVDKSAGSFKISLPRGPAPTTRMRLRAPETRGWSHQVMSCWRWDRSSPPWRPSQARPIRQVRARQRPRPADATGGKITPMSPRTSRVVVATHLRHSDVARAFGRCSSRCRSRKVEAGTPRPRARRRLGRQPEVREEGHDHLPVRDVSEVLFILPLLAPGTFDPAASSAADSSVFGASKRRGWLDRDQPNVPGRSGSALDC